MMLQALCQYYDRLSKDAESGVASLHYSVQAVHFALVIDKDGRVRELKDIRNHEGKKPQPAVLKVPEAVVRSGKPTTTSARPNFLWDNAGYVLGADKKGKPENARITFSAFKRFHHLLGDDCDDVGIRAVLMFLDNWDPEDINVFSNAQEMLEANANLVFLLEGDKGFVYERPAIRRLWLAHKQNNASKVTSTCLVTGKHGPIARLHPKIKGVQEAQSSGASIVSYNLDAFCSYNKEQSYNAPISEEAAFAYTTALNHLLSPDSRQKILIGDATTVFWTERKSSIESIWGQMFDLRNTDAADNKQVGNYLSAIREGRHPPDIDTSVRMYILGLSPNAARLAVRFWLVDTVEGFDRHLHDHFENLRIQKQYESDRDFPGIWHLLIETLPKKKELRRTENLNPLLSGALTRCILAGGRYPESLLATIAGRLRTDGDVSYLRSAMIKAILRKNHNVEVTMGLDEECALPAYRLGRLFAVLERAQIAAIWGERARQSEIGATIKDRFYGAASATPRIVFPQLLRSAQHHLTKAEYGKRYDSLIQEIVKEFDPQNGGFPTNLDLKEQGLFALGYYHQRGAFFVKSEKTEPEQEQEA